MTSTKRSTCKECGTLVAPSKSLCTKCAIDMKVTRPDMAARMEQMEDSVARHLDEMKQWREEISSKMDYSLHDKILTERGERESDSSNGASEPSADDAMGLESLAPIVLARLDRLCSDIRHSIVEACFYNLKLQAQLLPKKIGSADFMQELKRNLEQLPVVAKRLREFFGEEIKDKVSISSLFKDEYGDVMEGLQHLRGSSPANGEPHEQIAESSSGLSKSIDAIISALRSIDDRIRKNRIDLNELLHDVAAASRERCEEAGVTLNIQLPEEPLPKIYSTGSVLSDTVLELIRNAIKHAFPMASLAEKCIDVVAHLGDEPHRPIVIRIEDNGKGLPAEVFESARAGAHPPDEGGFGLPMIIHNIENLHGGQVSCRSAAGEGTRFTLSIPSRI